MIVSHLNVISVTGSDFLHSTRLELAHESYFDSKLTSKYLTKSVTFRCLYSSYNMSSSYSPYICTTVFLATQGCYSSISYDCDTSTAA